MLPPDVDRLLADQRQEHLISHLQTLAAPERARLLAEIVAVPWCDFSCVYRAPKIDSLAPATIITRAEQETLRQEACALGAEAYARGEVAVSMVAGGQGTRLGSRGPKGCYPMTPLAGKAPYQFFSEKIANLVSDTGSPVYFLPMTSPATHFETSQFFKSHDHFGLDPEHFRPFCQTSLPTTDQQGRLLLGAPDSLLQNPNGHGGWLDALRASGILGLLRDAGVKDIIFIQVDNLLAPVRDELAVGLRRLRGVDIVSKVMHVNDPFEKVGRLVTSDGRPAVIEYIDIEPAMLDLKDPAGGQLLRWNVPNMHVFSVEFLERFSGELPCHLSKKQVPQAQGGIGVKREKFIYDLFPAATVVGLEIERGQQFAPVKNLTGVDSLESAARLLASEYKRWLRAAGVDVQLPDSEPAEVSPLIAASCEQLVARWPTLPGAASVIRDRWPTWLASGSY